MMKPTHFVIKREGRFEIVLGSGDPIECFNIMTDAINKEVDSKLNRGGTVNIHKIISSFEILSTERIRKPIEIVDSVIDVEIVEETNVPYLP